MFLLILGNGFSLDLCQYLEMHLTTSFPFRYNVPDPSAPNKRLLDKKELTRVANLIAANSSKDDYEIIRNFLGRYSENKWEDVRTHYELRQYLSLAYSYLNNTILNQWKNNWKWQRWIYRHYKEMSGVYTLNYDLVLETTLAKSSLPYYRVGSTEEDNPEGIPIFKPHGSCDFDIIRTFLNYVLPAPPLTATTVLCENIDKNGRGRVEIVRREELMQPRTEADIVLPLEFSPQIKLTWVRQGYETFERIATSVDACMIVGISYQECDRKEIDMMISNMHDVRIQLICPNPNILLEEKLKTVSDNVQRITPVDFDVAEA